MSWSPGSCSNGSYGVVVSAVGQKLCEFSDRNTQRVEQTIGATLDSLYISPVQSADDRRPTLCLPARPAPRSTSSFPFRMHDFTAHNETFPQIAFLHSPTCARAARALCGGRSFSVDTVISSNRIRGRGFVILSSKRQQVLLRTFMNKLQTSSSFVIRGRCPKMP